MAKSSFSFTAPQKVAKAKAEETAKSNDAARGNFDLNAETGEILTLTGNFFESVWTRTEEGKDDRTGTTLMAEATGESKQTVLIPFGLFKSANKLASGGEVMECKAHFSKRETNENIFKFCKKDTTVKVARYLFFREGNDFESEITKVI